MVLPLVRRPVLLPLLLSLLVLALVVPAGGAEALPPRAAGVSAALPDKVMRAGVASVDASWHLGAGGGQFAATQPGAYDGDQVDPFLHATKKRPARGLQSRIVTRALLVEGVNAKRFAVVANDLYLPNDLLNRRVAQLLEQHDLAVTNNLKQGPVTGISEDNLAITVSHNHNSAFYSSPSYGTWVFQDVFDLRFFEYMSTRMAQAVIDAAAQLRPVRIGAVTVPFNEITAHTIGPKVADDGTPAGQPYAHTTGQLTVVRVDDLTDPTKPEPYANWITLGLHPEFTWGYELFSGDITHAAMRIVDRELGTTSVMSQRETGSSGPHKDLRVHEPEERREFQESGWQQLDIGARLMADAVQRAYRALDTGEKPAPYDAHAPRTDGPPIEIVPFGSALEVSFASARFAPPTMRPVPGVSNCNTASLFHGNWQVPVLGFPDCDNTGSAVGQPIVGATPVDERAFYDQLKELGVPVPESYFGPSFTLLEETAAIHLMAVRIGDIAATFCPCEQFTDTALNIQSRLNDIAGDVWRGYDWTTQKRPDGSPFCQKNADSTWTCADPRFFREAGPWPTLPPVGDLEYQRMRAQINNDADGWEELTNASTDLFGEAEPADPADIKGNFTHREITEYGAPDGYGLTISVGMANDYFGYTPEYREMRGYDHYRKALNGLGLHGADYLATRLVRLAASLRGGAAVTPSPQDVAYQGESGRARAVSQALGELANKHTVAYDATLPADGGTPDILAQPKDIKRFDGATVRFVGGSSYTDLPHVTVERKLENGTWVAFADQSGEVQTEVRFPTAAQMADFAAGRFAWEWTASWEAFVSEVEQPDLSGEGHRATPAGTYRFAVKGQSRKAPGNAVAPYALTSTPFEVRPWDGLTVDALSLGADGSVSAAIGPATTELFAGRTHAYGPIDYPDGWDWGKAMKSVADQRLRTEKGTFGEHKQRVYYRYRSGTQDDQAYCLFCRFHPWQETGEPAGGTFTVTRKDGTVEQWNATVSGARIVATPPSADAALKPGDTVQVAPGGVVDAWGNTNAGSLSRVIADPNGEPTASASPTPTEVASGSPTPTATGSTSASPTPGQTAPASSAPSATASSSSSASASASSSASSSPSSSPSSSSPLSCTTTARALPVRVNTPTINATGLASVTVSGARPGARIELQGYSQNHEGTMTFDRDMTPVDRSAVAEANGTVTFNDLRPASNTRVRAHEATCPYAADATGPVIEVRATQTLRVVRNGPRTYTFSGTSIPARPGGLIVSLFRVVGTPCAAGVEPRSCPGERFLQQVRAQGLGAPSAGSYGGMTVTFPVGDAHTRHDFVVKTGRDAQNAPGRSNVRSLLIY